MEKEKLIVNGYLFGSLKDADVAREELERIEYLNKNVKNYTPKKLLLLYDRILDEKLFQTPIGWSYLVEFKEYLIRAGVDEASIRPIPLYHIFAHEEETERKPVKQRIYRKPKPVPYKSHFQISFCVNIALVIAVVGMFVIALKSDTPNMINYKNQVTNSYAAWDQELQQREQVIREKERALGIVNQE